MQTDLSGAQAPRRPTYADVATQVAGERSPERPPLSVGKIGFVSPPLLVLLVVGGLMVLEELRWSYMVSRMNKADQTLWLRHVGSSFVGRQCYGATVRLAQAGTF